MTDVSVRFCSSCLAAAFCGRLSSSSILYSCVYGFLILLLVYSLFYSRIARTALYHRIVHAIGADTWTADQPTMTEAEEGGVELGATTHAPHGQRADEEQRGEEQPTSGGHSIAGCGRIEFE
jgi:hypothetical protein